MLKRLVHAAATAFAIATALAAVARPTSAATTATAHAAYASPVASSAMRDATVLLAQAGGDMTGQLTDAIQKIVDMFTGRTAKLLVLLAMVAACITILQRPDAPELIGAVTKVGLIGVIIISAQSIVGFVYGGF